MARAKPNPMDMPSEAMWGEAAGMALHLLGAPRLGGALVLGSGLYSIYKGSELAGGVFGALGLGMLFSPEIQGALSSKSATASGPTPKASGESSSVPIYNVTAFDTDIGGGWTMLDVRTERDASVDAAIESIHAGQTVFLVLSNKGAPSKVFAVKLLGFTGDDYTGQWISDPPAGGPQMIDFRSANIYQVH